MALDRQMIEKRDFPVGRRGYDAAAVDAHLQMLADEFDALRRTATRHDPTLAQSASEQVRLIVEAAERSAAEIRREAGDEAAEHVRRVSQAAEAMLERVEAMQRELGELTDALRTGTSNVNADLSRLSEDVREVGGRPARAEAAPVVEPDPEPPGPAELAQPVEPLAEEPEPAAAADGADEEGARLIALNMALNGTPREETERYLADNYELADPQALLDDVYARAGQ